MAHSLLLRHGIRVRIAWTLVILGLQASMGWMLTAVRTRRGTTARRHRPPDLVAGVVVVCAGCAAAREARRV